MREVTVIKSDVYRTLNHFTSRRRKVNMHRCTVCEKSYAWSHDLNSHVKHKHTEWQQQQKQQQQQQQQQQEYSVFFHPFTANVSGPTSCGKTYFVKSLLHNCLTKI